MAVPPLFPNDALAALRKSMRKVRQRLDKEQVWRAAVLPPAVVTQITGSHLIGLYSAMSGEPDPGLILAELGMDISQQPVPTALPALAADSDLMFRRWTRGDPLTESPWNGLQPFTRAEAVVPDVIFVPLLAFDDELNRLGQGGGHYDRYFACHERPLRVGVAWEEQRVPQLATRPWDITLDAVITEQYCYLRKVERCRSQ
ncbi:5-formyltetrahydrofolate cyclo-ligase [Sphingomonas sp.]|uniref:5-formyltetrahydrofolate cyclo-ligase n=1 Tax=Sphingomonas sp. TaxID=28214 RepID=UPI0025D70FBE|nr:5-formyltetrahydrofolate cyclo-ligase [Sphingomonas sp.]